MQIRFTLGGISGKQLFDRFAKAIEEENTGWDDMDSARLSEDGTTWYTAWSGFLYEIQNPQADGPATVIYEGACRGFLSQNLLPAELDGETTHAEVIAGSALKRHGVEKFEHTHARDLAKAYGLMQKKSGRNPDALKVCLAAIGAEQAINNHLESIGLLVYGGTSFASSGPNSGGHGCTNTSDGDPAVFVTCRPGGEQVTLEIQLHPWGSESTAESVIARATKWIDRIRPVCERADLEPVTANG